MRLHENGEKLASDERATFQQALDDAYNLVSLCDMVQAHLGWETKRIINERKSYTEGFFDIIDYAEYGSRTRELLAAALIERPDNKKLLTFAERFMLKPPWEAYLSLSQPLPPQKLPSLSPPSTQLSPEERLERKIRELDQDLNVVQWRKQLERLEGQICRIEVQKSRENIYGTGFLVGPALVMTNYHIVNEIINGQILSHKVRFFFDYKLDEKGEIQNSGSIYELADDWYEIHSEGSDRDLQKYEHIPDMEAHKLDFALLYLKEAAGLTPVKDEPQTIRGWMELPAEDYDFKIGEALFILHHPNGDPLQLAMNTQGVKEINQNKTRIWYTTSTTHGSSGAPCFNLKWQLVAMHQSGDPEYRQAAEYNQGIPLATIYAFLQKRGKGHLLNTQPPSSPFTKIDKFPDIEFALPEGAMDEYLQKLLLSKLNTSPSHLTEGEQEPIVLNEEHLREMASSLSIEQTRLLCQEYINTAKNEITDARKPFDGEGNLRRSHYTCAVEAIDVLATCLRKACILLNSVDSPLDITMKVDQILVDMEGFRQDIEKNKNRYSPFKKRLDIRNSFEKASENLDEISHFIKTR